MQQQAVIQCKEKVVVVTAPNGERIRVDVVIQAQPTATVNQLDDSGNKEDPVVDEFLDVFPDDLPGMPHDRDIEFIIELLPGTTPIAKRPYRMGVNELEELKKQIKSYRRMVPFVLVRHLGEHRLYLLTRRMVLRGCVLIIGHSMRLLSRTSICCLELMICFIS